MKFLQKPLKKKTKERCSTIGIFLFLFLIYSSCISPLNVDNEYSNQKLVVEGWVTNSDEDVFVRIFKTAPLGSEFENRNIGVADATVSLSDNLGKETVLIHTGDGYYKNARLKGEVGKTYKLTIKIDEKIYQSKPQLLNKPPVIDSLYYEFKESVGIDEEGFYTFIDYKDPSNEENYYRWKWEYFKERKVCNTNENCCNTCFYVVRCADCIDVFSDRFTNGENIVAKNINIVPFHGRRAIILKVKSQSVTQETFLYFKNMEKQIESSTNVFSTPLFTIPGNMVNVDDPGDVVLGYFGVAGESIHHLKIEQSKVSRMPTNNTEENSIEGCPRCPCAFCPENNASTAQVPPLWFD